MSEKLWRIISKFCARPAVADFLIHTAMRRPYLHIGDYMLRYWLVPFSWGLPFSIRIHHIKRPDADPFLHDHPWNWRTIVLRGSYLEETVFGDFVWRKQGQTRSATAETFHRIAEVDPEGVWTLFIMGRRRNRWGFMAGNPARKIYYRDYISVNDRGELQVPQP